MKAFAATRFLEIKARSNHRTAKDSFFELRRAALEDATWTSRGMASSSTAPPSSSSSSRRMQTVILDCVSLRRKEGDECKRKSAEGFEVESNSLTLE